MNTHADNTSENKSQAVANSLSKLQTNSELTFQFEDNRPEAIVQREMQDAANNSANVQRLRMYQQMATDSPQVKQLRAYQAMADSYTSQQIQRKENSGDETLQGKFDPIQEKENNTGLPGNLKSGLENLSGYSMDDVKVHFNSAKPAQLQAHAYAQGTDIHLASGQEKHLPHEAWHVVQQKQGRVKPTIQLKGEVKVNNDQALEKEADTMGNKASFLNIDLKMSQNLEDGKNNKETVQRVRGGIEYTEDAPTTLHRYNVPGAGNPLRRRELLQIGAAQVSAFVLGGSLGNRENSDERLMQTSNEVKLTNDVISAEWVIERHHNDVTPAIMRQNLYGDIAHLFDMRNALKNKVENLQHPGAIVILCPGNVANLRNAVPGPGIFVYRPGPNRGQAQITAQYSNEETIKRINLLNASKFLRGTKVANGEDIPRISGREPAELRAQDVAATTSFSTAGALLANLVATSLPIVQGLGAGVMGPPAMRLTSHQVGLIKLMVINDALSTAMVRYHARLGQAQQKNLQRFFPKSRRDEYTKTIAKANLNAAEMGALNAEINRTSAVDALLLFNAADPGALRTDETFFALGAAHADMGGMLNARQILAGVIPGHANPADLINIKTHVLGMNGALVATWIGRAANAYTDTSVAGVEHYQGPGANAPGNVISSTQGFTPVAPGTRGAIYEMREREVAINRSGFLNIGSLNDIKEAIDSIFGAV